MKTGINIGMPSTLGASDAAIQAGQGVLSSIYGSETDGDGNLIITIDMSLATSRLNSDGNYYTITFPDDFIGTRGTIDDAFKDARSSVDEISLPAHSATANLDVILNIPAGMRIGANVSNNIIPPKGNYNVTDPSLYFKFNTSDWTPNVLTRLNITVNNYGVLFGAGGSGGWGGMKVTDGIKPADPDTYPARGGAGSGQGLHPAHGTTTLGDFYDPDDTTLPAGQAGSGYKYWGSPQSPTKAANGTHGTIEDGGFGGAGVTDAGSPPTTAVEGGLGHYGGSIIYYDSDVTTPTTGTHIILYNEGWMSAGCGGGSGRQLATGVSGHGGDWDVVIFPGNEYWRGSGGLGSRAPATTSVLGGYPGQLFEKAVGINLSISNNVINNSGNNIYGWDETWPPL